MVNNDICWAIKEAQQIKSNAITFSIDFEQLTGTQGRLMCFNENDVQTETYSITSFPLTINFNQNSKYYVFYFVNSLVPFNSKLQLTEGTSEHPYVPYGNNYVDVAVRGKNLLKFDDETYNSQGINSNITNNVITMSGTANSN